MHLLRNIEVVIAFLIVCVSTSKAQTSFEAINTTSEQLFLEASWKHLAQYGSEQIRNGFDYFGLNYRAGVAYFNLSQFNKAEYFLRKALQQNNSSKETVDYLYHTLISLDKDCEAAALAHKYSVVLTDVTRKKFPETIYLEGGLKMINDLNKGGNIHYSLIGLSGLISEKVRLWQTVSYLQQEKNKDGFRQYEYFAAFPSYLGDYWYVRPSLHWAYTDFNSVYTLTQDVSYTAAFGNINYNSYGIQSLTYEVPGNLHSFNLAANLSRRYHSWNVELEPSVHYIQTNYSFSYKYTTNGVTDSLINGAFAGTKPFQDNGSSNKADTTEQQLIGQIGIAASYCFPVFGERITIRIAGYYLFDKERQEMDWSCYGLIKGNNNIWIHINYLKKRNFPLALNYEGQYFNAGNPVENRFGCSLQLFPLRKFSPIISYQYEQQIRLATLQHIGFNACYLTLKYNL